MCACVLVFMCVCVCEYASVSLSVGDAALYSILPHLAWSAFRVNRYTHISTCIHSCIYIYIHTYIYVCVCACVCAAPTFVGKNQLKFNARSVRTLCEPLAAAFPIFNVFAFFRCFNSFTLRDANLICLI